jgi:replication factor C large subunit
MATAKKQKTVRRTLSAALAEGYSIPDIQVQSEYIDLLSWVAEADPEAFCERHNLDADQLTVLLHDKTRAAAAFKAVQKAAKEKEIKVKKAAAAKKAEARKKADLEEALRKAEEAAAVRPAEPEPVPVVEEEKPVEKKPAATQSTLDFF